MKKSTLTFAIAAAMTGMLMYSSGAIARKVCADGSYPPCNTEGETATNNLSLPLLVTPQLSGIIGVNCTLDVPTELVVPSPNEPISGYPIDPLAFYYVQGIHKWQAPCAITPELVAATAAWGDNLAGDAKLKVGSPIRVEIVLTEDTLATQQGYTVVKLDPAALDRESPYGTLATDDGTGFSATPTNFPPLVFDSQAELRIEGADFLVTEEPASAEINATGKVIYGYNLRVPATGDYTITYTFPNVFVNDVDAGECVASDQGGTVCTLPITVGTGGGGGGGKGRQ